MVTGRGTLLALIVLGASCEPNTERIIPGAKVCLKDAPFATPWGAGVAFDPGPAVVTLKVTAALELVPELSW
jgi:hypothetical protein